MNPTDVAGWALVALLIVGNVAVGFGARRVGYGLLLATAVAALVVLQIEDKSVWWLSAIGAVTGFFAIQFGKELRKGGAK
jgi:hypothetical protein